MPRQGEGGGSESSGNQPTAAPSSGTEGLVYPGPQLTRSDSPQPTSRFQTLLQPDLEDLPILEGRLDLPNFLSMPEVPDTVKPEEEQPADPSEGVATEPVQAQLADLPISKRHLDLSNLFSIPEVGGVPWSEPAHQAVGLPDTVKPEEPEPVDPSDGVTEAVQAELADLPFLKRRLDVPNLVSMLDLPDTVKPEEEQPVDPSDDVATEAVQAELADLPFLKRRLDVPNLLSMQEVSDTVKPEEEQPVDPSDDVATEPVQRPLADLPIFKLRLDLLKTDLPNILALTPMPTPLELPVEIPAGEVRGRFTIAPEPNLDTSETEPGSPSAVLPGDQGVGLADENALSTSVVNITLDRVWARRARVPRVLEAGMSGPALDRDRGLAPVPARGQAPAPAQGLLRGLQSSVELGGPGLPARAQALAPVQGLLRGLQSSGDSGGPGLQARAQALAPVKGLLPGSRSSVESGGPRRPRILSRNPQFRVRCRHTTARCPLSRQRAAAVGCPISVCFQMSRFVLFTWT